MGLHKSNKAVFTASAVLSLLLLGLWFYQGFHLVDDPGMLGLSGLWWLAILAAVAAVAWVEHLRRRRIRTVYVTDKKLYNSETGVVIIPQGEHPTDTVATITAGLRYGFSHANPPGKEEFPVRYLIRTKEFKGGGRVAWTGEVVIVSTGKTRSFETSEQLADIMAKLDVSSLVSVPM